MNDGKIIFKEKLNKKFMTHKRGVEALGGEPILLRDYMG